MKTLVLPIYVKVDHLVTKSKQEIISLHCTFKGVLVTKMPCFWTIFTIMLNRWSINNRGDISKQCLRRKFGLQRNLLQVELSYLPPSSLWPSQSWPPLPYYHDLPGHHDQQRHGHHRHGHQHYGYHLRPVQASARPREGRLAARVLRPLEFAVSSGWLGLSLSRCFSLSLSSFGVSCVFKSKIAI